MKWIFIWSIPSLILGLIFVSCNTLPEDPIMTELFQLNTNIMKKEYLEEVFRDDQGKNENIPENVGEINRKKIFAYLDLYGHPKKADLGELAALTPWIVIHHDMSEKKLENRQKYFPVLFQAYLRGDIRDNEMTLYLNRFYELRFGERLAMKNPYTSTDEIGQLIALLNLEQSSK